MGSADPVWTGFAVVAVAVTVGYGIARFGTLPPDAPRTLAHLAFSVLTPCLLFGVLANADLHTLFSSLLPVSAAAAGSVIVAYLTVALVLRRSLGDAVIGAMSAGYVNANNIGLPISTFLLGDPAYSAPVVLLQLIVIMPLGLTLLDIHRTGRAAVGRIALRTVRNPLLIAAALGLAVSLAEADLPAPLAQPIATLGQAAIPLMLVAYGMTLHGKGLLRGNGKVDVVVAATLKAVVMPLAAWGIGVAVGLDRASLLAVVTLAALPTAQNIANFAQAYSVGELLARDTILLTTLASVPVLIVITALL